MIWAVSLLTMELIPHSLTAVSYSNIRSLINLGTPGWGPQFFSALPSLYLSTTLALKLFRGEPAISKLDWNFTTSHKSSTVVSTKVGSVLHGVLPPLQPAHG